MPHKVTIIIMIVIVKPVVRDNKLIKSSLNVVSLLVVSSSERLAIMANISQITTSYNIIKLVSNRKVNRVTPFFD